MRALSSKLAPIALAASTLTCSLNTHATLNVMSGGTLSGVGSVNGDVTVMAGGTLAPGEAGVGCLSADTLTMMPGSTLRSTVAGTTQCTNYTAVLVGGVTLLNNVTLEVNSGPFMPSVTDQIQIVGNTSGSDTVVSGSPLQGDTILVGGVAFSVLTAGGNGNDLVLAYLAVPSRPVISSADGSFGEGTVTASVANEGASAVTNYSVTCTGNGQSISASGNSGVLTLSGLAEDVSYDCTVTATNATGDSQASLVAQLTQSNQTGLPIWLLYEASQP